MDEEERFRALCMQAQTNTIPQLKQMLRERKLKTTGNKQELCARLAASLCQGESRAAYCAPSYQFAEDIAVPSSVTMADIPAAVKRAVLFPMTGAVGAVRFGKTSKEHERLLQEEGAMQ